MTEEKTFSIEFGALAPKISEQIVQQGLTIPENRGKAFDDIAHAIVLLHLHGIIPDGVRDSARQKVMKQISKEIHKP